jgi:carbonic anhydrase
MDADEALQTLMDGNKRHAAGLHLSPNQTVMRRREVAQGQKPFAIILGCSDSRIPPEIVFDAGLGDLFVVRVGGNVVDDLVLGSIEYAVEHLGPTLIMVLGHQRCGAVQATVEAEARHGAGHGPKPAQGHGAGQGQERDHTGSFVAAIRPAVAHAREQSGEGDLVDRAVRANVTLAVARLRAAAPILAVRASAGRLKLVGARYDLDSGEVTLL